MDVTHAAVVPVLVGAGVGLVAAGVGLVAAEVGELGSVADGDERVVAGADDGDDDRHHRCLCLQVTRDLAEEECAARVIGIVKPVSRAAATTTSARIAFMRPRP